MKVSQITRRMSKDDYFVVKTIHNKILYEGTVRELKKDNPINPKFVLKISTSYVGNIILSVKEF